MQFPLFSDSIPQKRCPKCPEGDQWHPATSQYFSHDKSEKDGWFSCCKQCWNTGRTAGRTPEKSKNQYEREKQLISQKSPDEQERIRVRKNKSTADMRKRIGKQVGICNHCRLRLSENGYLCEKCRTFFRERAANQRESRQAAEKQRRDKLRVEVCNAYGGKCACCGESHIEFLAIDHVNNDGKEHRKTVKSGGPIYRWLRRNGYPQEDFQLLCNNCNYAKYLYGVCPHQNEKS